MCVPCPIWIGSSTAEGGMRAIENAWMGGETDRQAGSHVVHFRLIDRSTSQVIENITGLYSLSRATLFFFPRSKMQVCLFVSSSAKGKRGALWESPRVRLLPIFPLFFPEPWFKKGGKKKSRALFFQSHDKLCGGAGGFVYVSSQVC